MPNRRSLLASCLAMALSWSGAVAALANAPVSSAPDEYAIKAAFLYRFSGFVEWPSEAFASPETSAVVCVLGRDPFGPRLDATFESRRLAGRHVEIRRVGRANAATACHIVFVSASERHRLDSLLRALEGRPILTVSDIDGFATSGGMIELMEENARIRFEVNRAAARDAGLEMSSRLLQLARSVHESRR